MRWRRGERREGKKGEEGYRKEGVEEGRRKKSRGRRIKERGRCGGSGTNRRGKARRRRQGGGRGVVQRLE